MTEILEIQGSLELYVDNGELMVRFADWYHLDGASSLKYARKHLTIGGLFLTCRQIATVKGWRTAFHLGMFDTELRSHMSLEKFQARYRISDKTLREFLPKATLSRWRSDGLPKSAITVLNLLKHTER